MFFEAYSPIAKDPSNIIEIILKVSSIAKEIVLSLWFSVTILWDCLKNWGSVTTNDLHFIYTFKTGQKEMMISRDIWLLVDLGYITDLYLFIHVDRFHNFILIFQLNNDIGRYMIIY